MEADSSMIRFPGRRRRDDEEKPGTDLVPWTPPRKPPVRPAKPAHDAPANYIQGLVRREDQVRHINRLKGLPVKIVYVTEYRTVYTGDRWWNRSSFTSALKWVHFYGKISRIEVYGATAVLHIRTPTGPFVLRLDDVRSITIAAERPEHTRPYLYDTSDNKFWKDYGF